MSLRQVASRTPGGVPPGREAYRATFVSHVLELIREGYKRLQPTALATLEEPDITGLLVEKMRLFIEEMLALPAVHWSNRYDVRDDDPVNVGGQLGKRRPRVDMTVVACLDNGRPTFPLEAKRLYPGSPTGKYIGDDGMGCFLTGKYGSGCPDVGMLGYVQTDSVAAWLAKVQKAIGGNRTALRVLPATGACFADTHTSSAVSRFRSTHAGNPTSTDLFMHHMLLKCF